MRLQYPKGLSAVFYIGQAANLRRRLTDHLRWSMQARQDRRLTLYFPRYEYAAALGARYAYFEAPRGWTARRLETRLLCDFATRYRSWPVANGAGSWEGIDRAGLVRNGS
jgi:hypothetical protein